MAASPRPPVWPSSYEVEYTFTLPYTFSFQSGGLSYPVHVWYNGANKMTRLEVYGGLDATLSVPAATYNVYPRINIKVCDVDNSTVGPTLGSEGNDAPPLPSLEGWEFAGQAKVRSTDAYMWRFTEKRLEKVNSYVFYTAARNGWPLKLQMMGVNLMTGSHYDEYLLEFKLFRPGPLPASIFAMPALCVGAQQRARGRDAAAGAGRPVGRALLHQLRSLMPSSLAPAAATRGGSVASPLPSPAAPLSAAAANRAFVNDFNAHHAPQLGYRLALNGRFDHMSHERFAATSLGLSRRQRGHRGGRGSAARVRGVGAYLGAFQRKLSDEELPVSVDYRGTGIEGGPVLDQASCGSCWAFAAAGAMQSAWYKATGEAALFSESQLVDCSWDYGNNGCGGGEMEPAIQYVVDAGGIVLAEDYQYSGQNGFCRLNQTLKAGATRAVFSGYMSVEGGEAALMEAVYTHGAVSVSFNAALPPFKFYSEGVYFNPECRSDPDHLDHAVLLVGYGTTDDGVDYWILKNSWSTLWGENGYAKMSRKVNDCGVTVDPVIAVVDPAAAAARIRELKARSGGEQRGGATDVLQVS